MLPLLLVALAGIVILVVSTDQFVAGAIRIANSLGVSSVIVGAVVLGCGTALPELALAFHRESIHWRDMLHASGGAAGSAITLGFVLLMVVLLSIPAILPNVIKRHSPLVLFATIAFAVMLRGSLNRHEGIAMIIGFLFGIVWVILSRETNDVDPFAPLIDDDYDKHGAYIEAPVMTPTQLQTTRILIGLFGTAVGAQMLAQSVGGIVIEMGMSTFFKSVVVSLLASVLPHLIVAMQALKRNNAAMAIGNLIGSNLFHSLAIGGLVATIRPYQEGGVFSIALFGIFAATALLTYILLRTEDTLSQKQGIALLVAYIGLVALAVPG